MPNALLQARIDDVITLTNRPDLVGETSLAVKNSTLKAHQRDYYPRDLYENSFACATEDFVQAVDYTALLGSRFRALSWMRKLDPTTNKNTGDEFAIITPDNALDDYGLEKVNAVYLAGNLWKIRTDVIWQYFSIGYYLSPDVTDDGYSSWVATQIPHAIAYEAARVIFKSVGHDEQAQNMTDLINEAYAEVAVMGVQLRGY